MYESIAFKTNRTFTSVYFRFFKCRIVSLFNGRSMSIEEPRRIALTIRTSSASANDDRPEGTWGSFRIAPTIRNKSCPPALAFPVF